MNDLNQLLRDWAARNEPTSAEVQRLQTRIVAQLSNVGRTSLAGHTDFGVPSTTGWIALGVVAASLLAAVTVLWPGRRSESARPTDIAMQSLPTNDLAARQSLFVELDRIFDGQWQWLGEVNGRSHLQTDDVAGRDRNDSRDGLAVRLTVVQRRRGESGWHVVWEASVLARSEEWVRLPSELTGDDTVSLWAYLLPDGSVLVENDVALTSPVAVRITEPHIFGRSSQPARLWSTQRDDGEFQLLETIARMEPKHG